MPAALHLQHPVNAYSLRINCELLQIIQFFYGDDYNFYNGHEADLDLCPDLPQRIKDSDKKLAEGAKLINITVYVLFLISYNLHEADLDLPDCLTINYGPKAQRQ